MSKREIILILVAASVAVVVVFYSNLNRNLVPRPAQEAQTSPAAIAIPQSLGQTIYEKTQNPIKDEVPTVSPLTNPIEGAYKNPFQ